MFESNTDVDFGDEFTLDFERIQKNVKNKRPLEAPSVETPKKLKIVTLPKNVVKRKFPGPAGLLPDRKDVTSSVIQNSDLKNPELEIPCSQMSLSVFQSSPWVDASRDYEPLVDQYDIKWIKTNATLNKLHNQKAPFLAAIIKSVECFEGKNLIVKVVLRDASGEIQGTIIHSLYEEYSSNLVAGSVIVLRQCGVLTTSYSNNHYLTITPKNLVTIYSKNNDEMVIISVQEITCGDLMAELKQVKVPIGGRGRIQEKENAPTCSQLNIRGSQEEVEAWQNAMEGLDMDSFLEDF
ncbi:hypothetical protein Zmor_017458 [Zophobas morio]|uniref:Homologous recombination OB-fold protein OB-fold domain-containing protein n=1 Tax=Zophobas morio TaxID=2755281 RepID=A0AA38MCL4_9CUCU|nr:hypothetical protein Zmor_017458 [Zophobas morio]